MTHIMTVANNLKSVGDTSKSYRIRPQVPLSENKALRFSIAWLNDRQSLQSLFLLMDHVTRNNSKNLSEEKKSLRMTGGVCLSSMIHKRED